MWEIFKDKNDWNEKSIVGFIAFIIMCVIMVADLVSGWAGKDLVINEFVYDSFVWVVLGCFGIAWIGKMCCKLGWQCCPGIPSGEWVGTGGPWFPPEQ